MRAASDRVPVTRRLPQHGSGDDEELFPTLVGVAEMQLYSRAVTKAERERWRREDLERDRRRIPIGFRPPGPEAAEAPE